MIINIQRYRPNKIKEGRVEAEPRNSSPLVQVLTYDASHSSISEIFRPVSIRCACTLLGPVGGDTR